MDREKLILSKLKFKYDKTDVLSIDHLELATGVITVFMGSNGSGKTTLLKLLSGLLKPEEGTVGFSSEVLRKRAVMVHQVPYLFAGSVKYNINFALSGNKTGSKKREKIIRTVLDQADLLHLINRKSSTLSGGEKHRLALARAIAVDPEILILDEPFAHIDTRSHLLIEKIIGNRATTGKSTILSTHSLSSAFRLADKIVHLDKGEILDPNYNFFKGFVKKQDDRFICFITDDKSISILSTGYNNDYRTAVIHYSDIFLSVEEIATSAQNQLKGTVTAMKAKEDQFLVTINCGIELNALITELSVNKFTLRTGSKVFVNFKASAVRLY